MIFLLGRLVEMEPRSDPIGLSSLHSDSPGTVRSSDAEASPSGHSVGRVLETVGPFGPFSTTGSFGSVAGELQAVWRPTYGYRFAKCRLPSGAGAGVFAPTAVNLSGFEKRKRASVAVPAAAFAADWS